MITSEELKVVFDHLNSQPSIGGEMDVIMKKMKAELYPVQVASVEEAPIKKVSKKK